MKVTKVEVRCVKTDRRLPNNKTSIVRKDDLILARGYVLISRIIHMDTPSENILQQSYFYILPLCKEG